MQVLVYPLQQMPYSSGRIRELRKQRGLTQEQFARKLGVSWATVNRWERDKTKPSPLAESRLLGLANEEIDAGTRSDTEE